MNIAYPDAQYECYSRNFVIELSKEHRGKHRIHSSIRHQLILKGMKEIYDDMLNLIRRSLYEFILCVKDVICKDVIYNIARMIWKGKGDRLWLRLKYIEIKKQSL